MRRILFLAALLAASPAWADVHPRYHEAAKAAAATVVVIRVERVRPGALDRGMGRCAIEGRVTAVERGAAPAVGARVGLEVDCFRRGAELPSSGIQWVEIEELEASTRGRTWLSADGTMLSARYYEILD